MKYILLKLSSIVYLSIIFIAATPNANGDVVTNASLTYDLDGNAFANGADVAAVDSFGKQFNANFAYDPTQTFLEFGLHGNSSPPGRPGTEVSFASLRNGWVRPNSSGLVADFNSSTLAFDPFTVTTVGASGQTLFAGGDSFWWGNDPIIAFGGVWNQFGNLSLRYDASRISGGNSGWLFTNNLVGSVNAFDVRNIMINATAASVNSPGSLTISGDLFTAPEFGDFFLIQKGIDVGNFTFTAVTAVPEPSSMAAIGIASAIGATVRWRRRKKVVEAASKE